jgi:hypothetical protein
MREPKERLKDMLDAIAKIERYAARGQEAFEQEELIQTWILYTTFNSSERRPPGSAKPFMSPPRDTLVADCRHAECGRSRVFRGGPAGSLEDGGKRPPRSKTTDRGTCKTVGGPRLLWRVKYYQLAMASC